MRFISLYFLLFLFCFTACSSDNEPEGKTELPEGTVTFGVGITGFDTRVSQNGSLWTQEDQIGTFMFETDMSQPVENSANILYSTSDEGSSVTFTSKTPLSLPRDGMPVLFMAYYPYTNRAQDLIYPIQLADQAKGITSCDLMYAVSDKEYVYDQTANGSHVALTFSHQLSKIVLKFVDNENQPLDVEKVLIQGMQTIASFDLTTAKLTPENSVANISTYPNLSNNCYEAIVFPSAITSAYKVSFIAGGNLCEWMFTDININLPELYKGYQYIFTIPVDEGKVTGPAIVDTIEEGSSSYPWGNGEITEGTADAIVYELFPEDGTTACADTELKMTFNGPVPSLGERGYIRIYNAEDNTLVDEINMGERPISIEDGKTGLNSWMDIIGVTPIATTTNRKRVVNYHPVRIEGNTVIIKPHSQRLKYNTRYYVTIDKTAITQSDFSGIYANRWQFTTRQEPVVQAPYIVNVSHTDAAADFYTLQGAIDYFAANVERSQPKIIHLDDGIYWEIIYLRDQDDITIKGTGRDKVSIQYDNRNELNGGTNEGMDINQFAPLGTPVNSGNRSVITIGGNADKIRFENLTIENTSGNRGQAEAIIIRNNGGSAAFVNCNFHGYQDTILSGGGYNWYYNCLITGATDFIWGCGDVSLFENCEIRAINNGRALQARVTAGKTGYVFSDCRFTVGEGITGKSLLISSYEPDNITFVNTSFSDVFINEYKEDGITLQPAIPSLSEGCKMYNCTNQSGTDFFELIPENKGIESIYKLTQSEYEENFGSRSVILNGYDNAGGIWFN